jgi:membrane protein implicated in regulation of membrane protease activity
MEYLNIWTILGVVSLILLALYWNRRNAVWGGLTIGIIVGLVIALFSNFDWWIVGKSAVSGTIIGFGAELLGKMSDKMRNRK